MATGNPFANVVAQDIMEPFPALLAQDADHSELADALRRSRVPFRPYVDGDGRFVGVAAGEGCVRETHIGPMVGTGSEALEMPETIPFDASFPEIYEAFSARGCSTLVVTSGDEPLGYITCDGFLSMIDPIHRESFAATRYAGRRFELSHRAVDDLRRRGGASGQRLAAIPAGWWDRRTDRRPLGLNRSTCFKTKVAVAVLYANGVAYLSPGLFALSELPWVNWQHAPYTLKALHNAPRASSCNAFSVKNSSGTLPRVGPSTSSAANPGLRYVTALR